MRVYDGFGSGIQYMEGSKSYTLDQMIIEVKNRTPVGRRFEQQVYDLTLTYMGKFTQKGE